MFSWPRILGKARASHGGAADGAVEEHGIHRGYIIALLACLATQFTSPVVACCAEWHALALALGKHAHVMAAQDTRPSQRRRRRG